jgi:hypothetical protein
VKGFPNPRLQRFIDLCSHYRLIHDALPTLAIPSATFATPELWFCLFVICLLFVWSLFVICLETRSQFAKTNPNHAKDEARRIAMNIAKLLLAQVSAPRSDRRHKDHQARGLTFDKLSWSAG